MPTMRRTILILSTAAPLLLLAACDGYEMQRYTGFPYDNQRTAGSGVQYVLAKMMPTKGPVLEPAPVVAPAAEPIIEIPPPPVETITPADPVFDSKARK
jgi:hypothetical protein